MKYNDKRFSYNEIRTVYRSYFTDNVALIDVVIRRCINNDEVYLKSYIQNNYNRNNVEKWFEMKKTLYQWQLRKQKQRIFLNEELLKSQITFFYNKLFFTLFYYATKTNKKNFTFSTIDWMTTKLDIILKKMYVMTSLKKWIELNWRKIWKTYE